ncbi:hypothetical protein U3C01_006797 [Pseudomonas aeruginosa]|nr:hypothetical protein [Pseudomonas aeruginosa]
MPRVNNGGNYCGHQPDAPRLELVKPSTLKNRPKILQRLQEEVRQYYRSPSRLPSLNAANGSKRQQRSERREACILVMGVILEYTDLASLRCGVPGPSGFQSLTFDYLAEFTGMGLRRIERAVADLKFSNILTVSQPRQLQDDGSYRGLAAVKAVNSLLFGAFGLLKWLKHERQRASERLAKKAKRQGGNLGQWSRSALAIGRMLVVRRGGAGGLPRIGAPPGGPPGGPQIDAETYGRMFNNLVMALKEEDPTRDGATCRQLAEAILTKKLAG